MAAETVEIKRAAGAALRRISSAELHFLENCVGCALCESVCPYTEVDPGYGPVSKAELLRRIYRKEMTISGMILGPLVHAWMPGAGDLGLVREVAYRCTNCWHCYTVCAFGINSGTLVNMLRTVVDGVGMTPAVLAEMRKLELEGAGGKASATLAEVLNRAAKEIGKDLPFDKKGANVLYVPWPVEAALDPDSVVATIKILDALGEDWSIPKDPLGLRVPVGSLVGDVKAAEEAMKSFNDRVSDLSPKIVLLSDGGYPYSSLRFELAEAVGSTPSYRVVHVSEYLAEKLREGKLKLRSGSERVTWHDPCKLGRSAGVFDEPREVLKAATSGFRELPHNRKDSYCVGGGGGMGWLSDELRKVAEEKLGVKSSSDGESEFLSKADSDLKKAMKRKMEDVKKSEAEIIVTACPMCVKTLVMGSQIHGPEIKVEHISTFVAERLG